MLLTVNTRHHPVRMNLWEIFRMHTIARFVAIIIVFIAAAATVGAQRDAVPTFSLANAGQPVLPVSDAGFDSDSIRFPKVVYHDGTFHMYYVAFTTLSQPQMIGYASSRDGINWQRNPDPVFVADGTGFDSTSINAAAVLRDDDGIWVMYYNGSAQLGSPPFGKTIGRATAPAPTGPWIADPNPVLEAGSVRDWDGSFIWADTVLKTQDGYRMYYSANGVRGGMVGLATSQDGIHWTKYDNPDTDERAFATSDPVLMVSDAPDAWDHTLSWGAGVVQTDTGFAMVYTGGATLNGAFVAQLGYAVSTDGIVWTKHAANPVLSPGHNTLFPSLVRVDDTYMVYYGGTPGGALTQPFLALGTVDRVQDR